MPELTRLGAAGADEIGALHQDLLQPPVHDGRPHVALNFVMTADGRVSYQGRAEIGTRTDRLLMFHLRSLADAVMIGAGTLRVDPFTPSVKGRVRQPLAIVVSRTCELPLDNRFFAHPGERLVATATSATPAAVAAVRAAGAQVEAFGDTVFHTVINRTIRFPETTVAGEPITSYASSSSGAAAYRNLAKEVLAR